MLVHNYMRSQERIPDPPLEDFPDDLVSALASASVATNDVVETDGEERNQV